MACRPAKGALFEDVVDGLAPTTAGSKTQRQEVCAVLPAERRRKRAVRRELPKTCSGRSSFARSRIYLGHENRTE